MNMSSSTDVEIGSLITRSPEIKGGRPRIAGTGITVKRIAAWHQSGMQPEEIAARVAKLCRDKAEYRRIVDACKAYMSANYSAQRIDALLKEACALAS